MANTDRPLGEALAFQADPWFEHALHQSIFAVSASSERRPVIAQMVFLLDGSR